jgi:hypothetical protein
MSKSEKTKLKGRKLAARLIGIRTLIGGMDWEPPAGERGRARQVLVHLADQRALWDLYDDKLPPYPMNPASRSLPRHGSLPAWAVEEVTCSPGLIDDVCVYDCMPRTQDMRPTSPK